MVLPRLTQVLIGMVLLAASAGCVRRTVRFNTDPQGAIVYLNDAEIGRTPLTQDFTWYGDYDIVYRKDGYTTLATHHRIRPPWYQVWPIDFFSEVLVPWEIHDHHDCPTGVLEPEPEPDPEELVQRADSMRDRTIFSEE